MLEGFFGNLPAAAGSFKVAGLNQIGLMDIFECTFVFLHGSGERFHADRSSSEFVDDGEENLPIHLIEPSRIDAEPGERLLRNQFCDPSFSLHLRIVPDPFNESVHDSGCAASTAGDFLGAGLDRWRCRADRPSA